jgi:hypothetical protein
MLDKYEMTDEHKQELINFIDDNKKQLRELSLRMVLKVADLMASFQDSWKDVAKVTCMRGAS